MTVNEGLNVLKALEARRRELAQMRQNSKKRVTREFYDADKGSELVEEPTYDIKAIDTLIVSIEAMSRKIDASIKQSNATTKLNLPFSDEDVDAVFAPLQ